MLEHFTLIESINLHNNLHSSYCYYSHFTDEEAERQEGSMICPGSYDDVQSRTSHPAGGFKKLNSYLQSTLEKSVKRVDLRLCVLITIKYCKFYFMGKSKVK